MYIYIFTLAILIYLCSIADDYYSKKKKKKKKRALENVAFEPNILEKMPSCKYCYAKTVQTLSKRILLFRWTNIIGTNNVRQEPYELYTSNSKEAIEFHKYIRTYINNFVSKELFFFDNISKELWRNVFSSISFDKPHLICIMHTTLSSNNVIGLSFIKRSLHDSWIY